MSAAGTDAGEVESAGQTLASGEALWSLTYPANYGGVLSTRKTGHQLLCKISLQAGQNQIWTLGKV
jgi:hypothetical protein